MTLFRFIAAAVLTVLPLAARATPIIIQDPFPGTSGSSASYDVIGDRTLFDIDRAVVEMTGSAASVTLGFRYKDTATLLKPNNFLANYSYYGINLGVGDLFFKVGGEYKYGVALYSHDGLVAGDLYLIGNTTGIQTAREALGDPAGAVYRYDEIVRMKAGGVSFAADGVIESIATSGAHSPAGGVYHTVSWVLSTAPDAFLQDLYGSTLHFSSATCGNDIIEGNIPVAPVPESGTLLLLGSGLAALIRFRPKS